jgi:hypothetical protein
MRLWSLHPAYLDSQGLVALWRESLLARKVLVGQTRGYRHHPQLIRFQAQAHPEQAIERYLWGVYAEALRRGYQFDGSKLGPEPTGALLPVTEGQMQYEWQHLRRKLRQRAPANYRQMARVTEPQTHPLFYIVAGAVEAWERR